MGQCNRRSSDYGEIVRESHDNKLAERLRSCRRRLRFGRYFGILGLRILVPVPDYIFTNFQIPAKLVLEVFIFSKLPNLESFNSN